MGADPLSCRRGGQGLQCRHAPDSDLSVMLAVGRLAVLALLYLLAAGPALAEGDNDESGVLVLGRVSDDPKRHYSALKPLLDYVVPRMADVGIREGRVLMARDAAQMASYLRRGVVDWITETPGQALGFEERAGARFLLLTVRDGGDMYQTVFFARRDAGIRELADLPGRSLAFQNLSSTSAYLVPAGILLEAGLSPIIMGSPLERPPRGMVGYIFARSESNIATWVHKRLVDAGTFSDRDWEGLQRFPESFRDDFVIFHRSDPFPRALELVRADLPDPVRERLREVLLAAGADPEARPALRAYFNSNRFVEIDEAVVQGLEALRPGVRRVRMELE
jgi:phosphonate transport system substrate-binding protein